MSDDDGIVGKQVEEGDLWRLGTGNLGYDINLVQLLYRQLTLNIEGAQGVNLVVEEIYAERVVIAVGIDIDDTASDSILTGFIDIILHLEPQFLQLLLQFCRWYLLSLPKGYVTAVEVLLTDNKFGQCSRVGYNLQSGFCAFR